MSKIVLDEIASGYQLSKVNENFQKIEDELNNKVLYRNPPSGEPNTVEKDIDFNGYKLYNVGDIQFEGFEGWTDLVQQATEAAADSEASRDAAAISEANAAASAADASAYAGRAVVRTFSGDGSTVAFDLVANPLNKENTQVFIGSVYQRKSTYSVSGNILTFNTAPPAGTNNIEVVIFESVLTESGVVDITGGEIRDTTIYYGDTTVEDALSARIPEIGNYAELRAYSGPVTAYYVRGVANILDGGAGVFRVDAADTTTADNGGTVLVDASGRRWKREFSGAVNVQWFGAKFDGTDESSAALAALAAHNCLYVPEGKTLCAKNIALFDNSRVIVEGTLKLPNGCVDFDRLIYGDSLNNVNIDINEINGNASGQSGNIGTHLIYLTNCVSPSVNLRNTHDHYVASGAATPSVDGIRNASTGAIFLYQCSKADVNVRLLEGWGREGIYLLNCTKSEVTVGHCQGKYLTEYSGVQVSGVNNSINRASVDFAGASAVGFDTSYGFLSNVIATNTRENSGVNFGHTGYPATGSVAENIVVDGSFGAGISVLSSSQDLTINNFSVQNTGESGIQFSDGVIGGKLSNGAVSYPARWNLVAGAVAEIQTSNVKSSVRDAATLLVNVTAGAFAAGETVTSIGGSAQVRKALQNLTGSQQRLFFVSDVPASYVVGNTITGSGGAVGTIAGVYVPAEYNEAAGGQFIRDPRYFPGTGNQIRFPDGTAIYTWNFSCAYTGSGAIQTFTQNFFSNTVWAAAPYVTATVSSHNSTSGFVINYLEANATTAAVSIMLNATVNQTYGVTIMAVGRWK